MTTNEVRVNEATARAVYDNAAAHFDASPLVFWERYGTRTVERLGLPRGARVLDVCSGSGSSVIAAARVVGRSGSVLGVDVSRSLLDLARRKAEREGLENVELRESEMESLVVAPGSFDAVVIVFGLFFADDMTEQLRALARAVRPGGVVAVTVWGPRLFEPLYSVLRAEVRRLRPDVVEYRPWDRVTTVEALTQIMHEAGLTEVDVTAEPGSCALERPEDFWTIVLGTGLRWLVEALGPRDAAIVRGACLERAASVGAVETNVIYAVARV